MGVVEALDAVQPTKTGGWNEDVIWDEAARDSTERVKTIETEGGRPQLRAVCQNRNHRSLEDFQEITIYPSKYATRCFA